MKKFILSALAAVTVMSCTSNKVRIQGIIEGATNGELVLRVLELNSQKIVDTIKIEDGKIDYSFKLTNKLPDFYYLYYKQTKIASFVLLPGDRIKFSSDTLGSNTVVKGSEESELLADIDNKIRRVGVRFDSLANVMNNAVTSGDTAKQRAVNYELGSLYVKQKQYSIKQLYQHPFSITNVTLLYQKFPNNFPIFADVMDVMLFRRAYDSLNVKYPGSIYVSRLKDEISYREKSDAFNSKIMGASETGFPDISLPDQKARVRSLSDLKGKVVILLFWTVKDVKQKMFNQDLLGIYQKYNSKGLEIFQVSVDMDKTAWARIVDEQKLPWINVCDGLGAGSKAVKTYNVTQIPTLYVIDRTGNIVNKNIFDSRLENVISGLAR